MSDAESAAMVERVRATARLVGAGVLVIDHDLAFITRISDRIVVLANGRVLAEGSPDEIRGDPAVAEAYLGASGAERLGDVTPP
jgi:ABC-type branched-subunit amino acid transport system ATPase component